MSTKKMADTASHMSTEKQAGKVRYTTFVGNGDSASSKTDENISLQEAFKRYRKSRQKDIRKARRLRKRWELRQGDPNKMAALRMKFVSRAKKYIGVPYAKKYWPPESPEYKSKMFLDCCGLVRQVMRDMAEDFGFCIGPWNQAYMYDTLPITIENEKDMKPGDLVFISATYYNPKSKKQRHNMTHVEIWAGDGPRTIGSRWNNGKVQIWDNYKFTAKSYYDETYHFKSIDTWLMGICESHCREHRWRKPMYNPSKKSVFAIEEQDISEDEAAGDDDENVSDDVTCSGSNDISINARGQTLPVISLQQNLEEIRKTKSAIANGPDNNLGNTKPANVNQSDGELGKTKSSKLVEPDKELGKTKSVKANELGNEVVKIKSAKTNEKDTEMFAVKGQTLPIISIQQNISEDVKMKPRRANSLNALTKAQDGSMTETAKFTKTVETQTEMVEVPKNITRQWSKPKENAQISGKPLDSVSIPDKENTKKIAFCNTDKYDGVSLKATDSMPVQVGMSELCLMEPNFAEEKSSAKLPDEFIENDILLKDSTRINSNDGCHHAAESDKDNDRSVDVLSEENMKTKIAWVALGSCPICQTDLNLISANKPCHEKGAVESIKDDYAIEEIEETEKIATSQTDVSETIILPESLKKPAAKQGIDDKLEVITREVDENLEIVEKITDCDKETVIETNCSNNALPKKPVETTEAYQTRAYDFDDSLPYDACHDVQSSDSDGSLQIQREEKNYKQTKRREKLQSSYESSGVIDLENPSEPLDDAPGSESSGKKSRGKKSPGGLKKETKLPACSLPTNMQPTFYIGGGNGVSLVEGPLLNLGWKRTTDKYDERFKLKWVECKSKINYGAFKEGDQLVNHLPNSHLLTNKLGLLNSLKEYERVTLSTKGRLPRLKMSEFHPETYKLDEKGDRDLFLEVYKDNEIWICKPIGMNQGKGIFLIRSREAINQLLEEREQKKQMAQKPGKPLMNRIVQRYILNPLLLDGRKFDVRAYMLIASTTPYLILYHKGYVRLSCHRYDPNDLSMSTHLTNQFIQKKDPAYKELKEETAWSMDKFNDYINEEIRPNSHVEFEEDWVYNTFTKQMQKIMIHCFNSVKHKLQARLGFFDLFGLDFMVDTEMRVWLIEVNTNPALHCNCEALKETIPGVVEESLYVAIECFEKSKKNLPLMPLQSLKHFTILYCGTRPNTIIPRQSRSVSPVKDSSSTASEKTKASSTGASSRTSYRLLTQSTPLVAASNTRKSIDKSETQSVTAQGTRTDSNSSAKANSSAASAKVSLPAIVKSDDMGVKSERRLSKLESRYTKSEFATMKTEQKLSKSDIIVAKTVNLDVSTKSGNRETKDSLNIKKKEKDKKENIENKEKASNPPDVDNIKDTGTAVVDNDTTESDNKEITEKLNNKEVDNINEQEEKTAESFVKEEDKRPSVVDTLTRTQNSLNLATSALGRITISLNQVGLTDSLLEEVRLKMTHADPALGLAKPNSAKQRGRENLDRGN